ncbi:hypothetical protein FHS18_002640 [Paenibacillus phyllosphaerae]|uniref:SLH domain-containing protein n=1 Tax=Paenibacillus phyllosphaerae TaxID=274593 RepID=A0A7W5AXI4_9BACL|nr:S-layer homology domain-containing protein [Paenibacillus phyllosphaerae]MBB3110573.1 hypothetical protein [Paenibacillus phyllosphaerae]
MTFKKKILVSTMAVSVTASAFAGIPFSEKGLAEKLGLATVASAATVSFSDDTTLKYLTELHDKLAETSGALDKVGAARDLIRTEINKQIDAGNADLVQPLIDKVNAKLSDDITTEEAKTLLQIIRDTVSLNYDPNAASLEELRTDETVRALIQRLAEAASVSTVTMTDFTTFLYGNGSLKGIKGEFESRIEGKSLTALLTIASDSTQRNALIEDSLKAVLDNSSYKFSNVASYYAIDKATLASVYNSVLDAVVSGATPSEITTKKNVIKQAALLVAGAYYELYLAEDDDDDNNSGGGSSSVVVTTPSTADTAVKGLEALKDAIAKATGAEKDKLIAEAVQQAAKAIATLSSLDLSKNVTVANGKASLTVTKAQVEKALADIEAVKKALESAAAGSSSKLPKLIIKINAGTIAVNETNVALEKDLVDLAASNGVSGFDLQISSLSVTVPVGGSFTGAIGFGVKNETPAAGTTGTLTSVSDVYDFSLTVDGKAVSEFDQPIVVKIPLKNASGVDKELLSVAKIVDGKLLFQGGVVEGDTITEPRSSFSSYVVVENKVNFNDVASVQAWAGRQIQVMAAKGAIEGRGQGNFDPKATVTRAEFAAMLVRGLNLDSNSTKENFADVQGTEWFVPFVAAAVEKGIINGRSADLFAPNATITRAEMATMVSRALKFSKDAQLTEDVNTALQSFSDADTIQSSLKEGVAFAAEKGLVVGNNGKFSPSATATRAEAAVIIYRAFNFAE